MLEDLGAGGVAFRSGAAFSGFAEAKDCGAVGGEIFFVLAGVGVGSRESGPDCVEQVAVGPVVGFDQGPESDDQGVDFGVEPGAVRTVGHGFTEGGPFG